MGNPKTTGPFLRLAILLFLSWPILKAVHVSDFDMIASICLGGGWFYAWKHLGKKKNWQYSFLYGTFQRRHPEHKMQFDYLKKDPLLVLNILLLLVYTATIPLAHSPGYAFVPGCAAVIMITFWILDLIKKPSNSFSAMRGG